MATFDLQIDLEYDQGDFIRKAARITGENVPDFMITAALERAEAIAEHTGPMFGRMP